MGSSTGASQTMSAEGGPPNGFEARYGPWHQAHCIGVGIPQTGFDGGQLRAYVGRA